MSSLAPFLIIVGAAFLLGVYFLSRQLRRTSQLQETPPPVPVNLASTKDAVLLSSGYGQITFANQHARQWFGINGGNPDLELLSNMANPSDVLRDLVAAEGRASFQIGSRRVDASSHLLPGEGMRHMVVVMRDVAESHETYGPGTARALVALSEIGQLLGTQAPLRDTLTAILESLQHAVPKDAGEISLWEPETRSLRPLAQAGNVDLLRALERSEASREGYGYSGWVTTYRQSLLIEEGNAPSDSETQGLPDLPFNSYIGTPLNIGDEFVGVLHMVAVEPRAFDYEDLALLESVANQVSTVLDKSRLLQENETRTSELEGIQSIMQAAVTVKDRAQLFRRLNTQIAQALGVELCGVLLYDSGSERLVGQPPFTGIPDSIVARFQIPLEAGSVARRVWLNDQGWYANWLREENLIMEIGFEDLLDVTGMRNMALVPMVIGSKRLGMVMAGNPRSGTDFDVELVRRLRMFAAQAAIVVDAFEMADRDEMRRQEFHDLQEIGKLTGQIKDFDTLFEELSERAARLLDVEMCGLLLHDPLRRALSAYPVFYGADDELLSYIQVPLTEGGALATLWLAGAHWLSNDLSSDALALAAGLEPLHTWVGMTQVLLVPIMIEGQAAGALLASNKRGILGFDEDDVRLLSILAAQVAILLTNSRLREEIGSRASDADLLRVVGDTCSSNVPIDTVIQDTLQHLVDFFGCDFAYVDFLDESSGQLQISPEHVVGATLEETLTTDAYARGFERSVVISGQPYLSNDLMEDTARLMAGSGLGLENLGARSAMMVALQVAGTGAGELAVCNRAPADFEDHDLDLLRAVAQLLGGAIQRTRLAGATDAKLRTRVMELDALARVSSEISLTVDLKRINDVIRQQAMRVMVAEGCTILMLLPPDESTSSNEELVLQRFGAAALFPDVAPVEQVALGQGQTVNVPSYAAQTELEPEPTNAAAALVEPIRVDGRMVGALHVYRTGPGAFDDRAVQFAGSLVKLAATAYGNAERYREQFDRNRRLSRRVEQLNQIFELGQILRTTESLQDTLEAVAHAVQMSTGFSAVMISLYDETIDGFQRVAQAGVPLETFEQIQQVVAPRAEIEALFKDKYRISQSYFLPAELKDEWAEGLSQQDELFYYHDHYLSAESGHVWRRDDSLLIPLRDQQASLIGYMTVDAPLDGRRPGRSGVETLEVFAHQAAVSVESARLLATVNREAESARSERDRMERLYAVSNEIQQAPDVQARLAVVARGIQNAGWRRIYISLRDRNLDPTTLIHVGYTDQEAAALEAEFAPGRVWRRWMSDTEFFSLTVGTAFYLRHDAPWVIQHLHQGIAPETETPPDVWHPADKLFLPIYGAENRLIGLIGMDDPVDGAAPTPDTLRPIELFARQASNAIELTRLYTESTRLAEQEGLFSEVMQAVTSTLDITRIIRSVAVGLQRLLPFTHMTVGLHEAASAAFKTYDVGFRTITNVQIVPGEPIPVEGTALGKAFREIRGAIYRLTDNEVVEYSDLAEWHEHKQHSVMTVPMMVGGSVIGALQLGSELEEAFGFDQTNLVLIQRMANLTAVAVENARLYEETRDLQRFSGAIVESIQQGIIVLDRDTKISTFNDFMRSQFGWADEAMGQSLFDYQPGYVPLLGIGLDAVLKTGQPRVSFNAEGQAVDDRRAILNFYLYPLQEEEDVSGVVILVEDVTEQAALEADLARRAEQLAALTEISSLLTATLEPDDVVRLVLDELGDVLPYDGVALWLREGDDLRIVAARGYEGGADELVGLVAAIEDSPLFREIAEHSQTLNVPDVTEDERFPGAEQRPTLSWLGTPLISKGEVIGLLALDKTEAGYYTATHEQLALAFANQAAVALENASLFAEARRRTANLTEQTERLSLLNRVSTMLAQSLDIENILEVALQESARAFGVYTGRAVMFQIEQHAGVVIVEYPRGEAPPTETIPFDENPALDYVRRTLQSLIVEDVKSDPVLAAMRAEHEARDVSSLAVVPLSVGGQVIGALMLEAFGETVRFEPERLELAQTIALQAAIAVQNANLLEQSFVRTRELETLFEASQATSLTLDLNKVIESVGQQMFYALDADASAVLLWDEVEQNLISYVDLNRAGDAERSAPFGTTYDLNVYPARLRVLEEKRVVIVRKGDDLHEREQEAMEAAGSATRMLVPLVVREHSIGLIIVDAFNAYRSFGVSEQRIARTLAGQAAIAIENARLNTETAAQVQEAFLINDLSQAVSAAVDMDELLPIVRTRVPPLTHAQWVYLGLFDRETNTVSFPIVVKDGQPVEVPPREMSGDEFGWIVRSNRPLLLVGDELQEVRKNLNIDTALPEITSFLGVPLSAGKEAVGLLAVGDERRSRAFGLNDQRILNTVAGQLAVAVQNARLFEELRRFNQELEQRVRDRTEEVRAERDRLNVLYNITAEMSATLDMGRVLTRALELLARAVGADQGMILLIDQGDERLYPRASLGVSQENLDVIDGLRTNEGLAGWVIQNHKSVVVDDVQVDPRWLQLLPEHQIPRATLAVLLETSDDVQGVLMLYSKKVGVFSDVHLRLVSAAANQLATSINNAELYQFIREQAERLGLMVREQQVEASKSTAIMEGIADGVMVSNAEGEIILFNTAAERVMELDRREILGRPIGSLSGLYGAGGRRWVEAIQQWMRDPNRRQSPDYLTETFWLEDRVVNVTLAPVNMGDQFLGTVSVFRDISREVEVDRMKTEFISNVSHELRTPMTSIKGYADLLVMGAVGPVTEQQREFLDTIKNNADRLSVLVNDLLNISRIDSSRVELNYQRLKLPHLAGSVLANLKGRIETDKKQITLIEEIPDDIPTTYGDPDKLTQVITNLLDNAYQYTPEGGKITVSMQVQDGDSILLTVSDTGIGIPENVQDRVFDRFFRNDEHAVVIETPGTGLGLAIVKELVEMHRGKIWLESEEAVGTSFYVLLPILTAPPD